MATILVIEDNKDTARMVQKILEPRGHTVLHAPNGLEGMKMARHHKPQLILLDIGLPDLDGKIIANQLRAEDSFQSLPIVAFTADNSPRAQRLTKLLGCTGFIAKPIDTRKFPDQIDALLNIVSRDSQSEAPQQQ